MAQKLVIDIDTEGRIINLLSTCEIDVIIVDQGGCAICNESVKPYADGNARIDPGDKKAKVSICKCVEVSDGFIRHMFGKSAKFLWERNR